MQARTSSKRLPAKVLLPIGGIPLAILCAKRLSSHGHELILATSDSPSDDYLSKLAIDSGIKIFRNELDDVLTRYINCSQDMADEDLIIRVTADNPLPDGDFIEKILTYFYTLDQDYLGTSSPDDGLPYGLSAEIFSLKALRRHGLESTDNFSREHVTVSMRNELGIKGIIPRNLFFYNDYSHLRVTIDTLEDYLFIAGVFSNIPCPEKISWRYLIEKISGNNHKENKIQLRNDFISQKCDLTLGTAQFGNKYGITNQYGCPDDVELCKILSIAQNAGIIYLDTARAYGIAESRLGKLLKKPSSFRIITKIQPFIDISEKPSTNEINNFIDSSVFRSCLELKRDYIDVVMIHRFSDLIQWYDVILNRLIYHIENGVIGKIGVSVYDPEEAIFCLKDKRIKHIQIPFNLLDYRWFNAEFLDNVKMRTDVAIHARSVFLQGLILNQSSFWPSWLKNSEMIVDEINNFVSYYKRKGKTDLCISYVRSFPWISSLVIGVDNANQLQEIIKHFSENPLSENERNSIQTKFQNLPERLFNPSKW